MAHPLVYHLELARHRLVARTVVGREAMSEPFRFEVSLHLPETVDIDPDEVVKSTAHLALTRATDERRVTGVVSEVTVSETATGSPVLWVVLEPRFALSRHRQNVKAFLHKTVVDIVSEVLGEATVPFELRLGEQYAVRPYTVQFRETDFHFVSRMLEEEGIHYFFDDAGTMVLGDNPAAYDSIGPAPFRHAAGMDQQDDAVLSMGPSGRMVAGKIALRDWNLEAPNAPMDVAAAVTGAGPEHYDFPGEYAEAGAGGVAAARRAEALRCQAQGFKGRASIARFAPGRVFGLHSAPAPLVDGDRVVTTVTHDFDRSREGFSLGFEALVGDQAFRPAPEHHEPVVPNPLVGFVTGPPGADIHTDELGRVKVYFPWDRLQPRDDTCSHWIPVLQDNTGHSVSVPRVGWEVLVYFLEGDPDRPVVLGRLYNAEDKFPITLPLRKSATLLRSLSSPTRDGTNFIEFEDIAGNERILTFAERDQDVVICHDKREHVLVDDVGTVKRDETIRVDHDVRSRIGVDDAPRIDGNQTTSVAGNRRLEAGTGEQLNVGGNHSLSIAGSHRRRIGNRDVVTAASIDHRVGGVILEASVKSNGSEARRASMSTVGGAAIENCGGEKLEGGQYGVADTVGAVLLTKAAKEIKTEVAEQRVTTVGGAMKITAAKEAFVTGVEELQMKSDTASWAADTKVIFEVGDTTLTLAEGQITIKTKSKIEMSLDDESNFGAAKSEQI